jgi:hypothetical protein
MPLPGLEQFQDEDRQAIADLLKCWIEHGDVSHVVVGHSSSKSRPLTYRVVLKNGVQPCPPVSSRYNMIEALRPGGWVVRHDNYDYWAFEFTDEALQEYRTRVPLSDADIRRRLGQHLNRQYQDHGEEYQEFDSAAVAASLGVEQRRLRAQARVLKDVGLAAILPFAGTGDDFSYLYLSRPEGVRWALGGFTDTLGHDTTTIAVTVNVNIQQFLYDLRHLPIPIDQQEEAAGAAEDFANEPTIEKVGRLMELAANTKELFLPIARLVVDNAEKIEQMLRQAQPM